MAGRSELNQVNVDAINQLEENWRELRKQLNNWMFDTNPKPDQTKIRTKINEVKEDYRPETPTGNSDSLIPKILCEPSPVSRDPEHILKYLTLLKQILNLPFSELNEILKDLNKNKTPNTINYLDRAHLAAFAFLLCFKHHLFAIFSQETANTDAFADYLLKRVPELFDPNIPGFSDPKVNQAEVKKTKGVKRKRSEDEEATSLTVDQQRFQKYFKFSFDQQVKFLITLELQKARDARKSKRLQFNKTLAGDLSTDAHIQELKNEGFDLIEVDVQQVTINERKNKETKPSTNPKIIEKNAIVVDRKTNKVLGILITDQFDSKEVNAIRDQLDKPSHKFWKHRLRGKQAVLGKANFKRKNAKDTNITEENPEIWDKLTQCSQKIATIYKKHLPKTFHSVMEQTKDFKSAGQMLGPEIPFSTIAINNNNPLLGHRDYNYHNYSAMFVLEKDETNFPTVTEFPEWSFEGQSIAFHVPNGGIMIADTDYLHLVPEVHSNRYSLVWFTLRDLFVSPSLFGYDSDLEEKVYEKRPFKRAKHADSNIGSGAGSGAGSEASYGNGSVPHLAMGAVANVANTHLSLSPALGFFPPAPANRGASLGLENDNDVMMTPVKANQESKPKKQRKKSIQFRHIQTQYGLAQLLTNLYESYVVLENFKNLINSIEKKEAIIKKNSAFQQVLHYLYEYPHLINTTYMLKEWGDMNAMELVTIWDDKEKMAWLKSLGGKIRKEHKREIGYLRSFANPELESELSDSDSENEWHGAGPSPQNNHLSFQQGRF